MNNHIHPCEVEDVTGVVATLNATDDVESCRNGSILTSAYTAQVAKVKEDEVSSVSSPPTSGSPDQMTEREVAMALFGLLYLAATLTLSVYYLTLLFSSMTNDLWWPSFNVSAHQSYLIDVYNTQLVLTRNASTTLDLTSNAFGISKDYSRRNTPILASPVYPRIVVDALSQDLATVIQGLLNIWGPHQLNLQYCWVDFNRTWEVAHTDKRQRRCYDRYLDNAAVYYESICRVINWNYFITGTFGGMFNESIGNTLKMTPEGRHWLKTTPYAFVDVRSEVGYWQRAGIRRFVPQYTNGITWGLCETISIRNAFGAEQTISLKRMQYYHRGYLWTTMWMYWGPWGDISYASQGYSLIRNQSSVPCNIDGIPSSACSSIDFEKLLNAPNTPTVQQIHNHIGPLNSIDLLFVGIPPSLSQLFSAFQSRVNELILSSDTFAYLLATIPSLTIDPVPLPWQDSSFLYFGGDPTCVSRQPTSFVQSSFSFLVSCTKEDRHELLLTPLGTLFGLWLAQSPMNASSVCKVSATRKSSCKAVFLAAMDAFSIFNETYPQKDPSLNFSVNAARQSILDLDVGIIQFAINVSDGTNHFLRQNILSNDFVWDVFGWMYIYDWTAGSREVVSFEGDTNIVSLISDIYDPLVRVADTLEVTKTACQYLWIISVITTSVLVGVGILVSCYSIIVRGRFVGRNLFHFNRIAGAVWIGRPLLVVRGITALILLSTTPMELEVVKGLSKFSIKPRNFLKSMVASSEAIWISYVMNDLLLVLTKQSVPMFAAMSCWINWIILVITDIAFSQNRTVFKLNRKCTVNFRLSQVDCASGDAEIGSLAHVTYLVSVQVICVLLSFLASQMWQLHLPVSSRKPHLLLSGTATAFLHKSLLPNGAWMIDLPSCVMCGLLPINNFIFDIKLWLLVRDATTRMTRVKWRMKAFQPPILFRATKSEPCRESSSQLVRVDHQLKSKHRLMTLGGLLYMLTTIFGSVSFITMTSSNMANDFWWANYNASREHIYMARLFNDQLLLRPHEGAIKLDDNKFVDGIDYTTRAGTAIFMPLYISQVLTTDATELLTAIRGLRSMDACLAPWISAQYCWLDFNKVWEMANSISRQNRCSEKYFDNAAAYLEPLLRNLDWKRLGSCWGTSLEIAFGVPLRKLPHGAEWWEAVQAVSTSEIEELAYWESFQTKTYSTDWQNYKSIGIIDTFDIQNAFGLIYPLTIKRTNGSIILATQTSMKMYWAFASDLWAINCPTTFHYNSSLIRQDGSFVFHNTSMEDVLIQNGTISALDVKGGNAYGVFRQSIGPFGSVDLKRLPAPKSLLKFAVQVRDTLAALCIQSKAFCNQYINLPAAPWFNFLPPSWSNASVPFIVGGNLLCDNVFPTPLELGARVMTNARSTCGSTLSELVMLDILSSLPATRIAAVLGARLVGKNITNIDAICATIMMDPTVCKATLILSPTQLLLNESLVIGEDFLPKLLSTANTAQHDMETLRIEIAQYGKTSSGNLTLLRHQIFDPMYPSFHFMAWVLAYDWAIALREVISFHGDAGTINVITSSIYGVDSLVNPLEIPVNVANYLRYVSIYVTSVIICVALLVFIYCVINKGSIEGLNLFGVNRVAGIVWIGRPFLFIRSMAAICLLSTQALSLENVNDVWKLYAASNVINESSADKVIRLFKTFLAAGEACWLGYVVTDFLSVLTAQYTSKYAIKCNIVLWGTAAILSWSAPVTHSASIDRSCMYTDVDFQLVCSSGKISIGSSGRFMSLVGICICSIFVCYAFERVRDPSRLPPKHDSFFLASSAKYLFESSRWIHRDVYYIDQSSAVINGLLSLRIGGIFYVFDVKIWRLLTIKVPQEQRALLETNGEFHLFAAIPLQIDHAV